MKVTFEDKSYLEIKKSEDSNKIVVVISAKDYSNPLKKITNSVEIDMSKFKEMINSI